jgi:mono/diheme cytochrome c family protein
MRLWQIWPALAAVTVGCSGESVPEEAGPTGADSVIMAADMYEPANFDTVMWDSQEARLERGSLVFNFSCARCHGPGGAGDGGFVTAGDTLHPPSFLAEDWSFADDRDGLRAKVFTGAEGGMPHWGLEGLRYRDVDAVTTYILEGLRGD